jgi:hypothetical protein
MHEIPWLATIAKAVSEAKSCSEFLAHVHVAVANGGLDGRIMTAALSISRDIDAAVGMIRLEFERANGDAFMIDTEATTQACEKVSEALTQVRLLFSGDDSLHPRCVN